MPTWTITLIYPRYRLLKEFVETKISLRLGGLHVKMCVRHKLFPYQVNFGKTVEHSNVLNVHAKAKHVWQSNVAEGQKCWTFSKRQRIERSCQGKACWNIQWCWMFMKKAKFVEHSRKESKLNLNNVHFVMHCQSDSQESFSFETSRAHGALGKGDKIKTSAVQKAKFKCSWRGKAWTKLNVLIVCLCTWK